MGFFFLVPGLAVSLVAYFCIEGMCTPRSFVQPASATMLPMRGAYGAPPYGATQARSPPPHPHIAAIISESVTRLPDRDQKSTL